jgi:hypothetical protein
MEAAMKVYVNRLFLAKENGAPFLSQNLCND